jgi:hypothetical protein
MKLMCSQLGDQICITDLVTNATFELSPADFASAISQQDCILLGAYATVGHADFQPFSAHIHPPTFHIDYGHRECDSRCLVETVRLYVRNERRTPPTQHALRRFACRVRQGCCQGEGGRASTGLTDRAGLSEPRSRKARKSEAGPLCRVHGGAATYTSALRLQMSLRGFSTMPARAAKVPMFATPRTK